MFVGSRRADADVIGGESPIPDRNGFWKRRSILIVAPSWPHPPTWGFATRVYQLSKQLARRHRVSLLAYGAGDPAAARRDSGAIFESVHLVPRPAAVRSKRRAQLTSLLSTRSFHGGGLRSSAMDAALAALLAKGAFDLIQVESSQLGGAGPVRGIPVVLDEHNIEYLLLRRLAEVESSVSRKAFGYIEAAKVRWEEAQCWARCDGAVFTSAADMAMMRGAQPKTPACVVPNGVDTDFFCPSSDQPDPSTVVFTGSINYRPNTDAVAYFVREVMPPLLRLRPSTKFIVVGQGAPDWLLRMSSANIEFTGPVDDIRPYLARASVVVAPLRVGSGTRLKILEALAMAKPVVTSQTGCEGLSVIHGEHLECADDPQTFAEETARLMSDTKLAAELGRNGRALTERDYSWRSIVSTLEAFHSRLIRKETKV